MTVYRNTTIEIQLSPEELAKEFCDMGDSDQVKLFNEVASITADWEGLLLTQMTYVASHEDLTDAGRQVMRTIGGCADKEEV